MRRNICTRAHLDQNLLPTYLSSEDAALRQVFDTLCVYRFASTPNVKLNDDKAETVEWIQCDTCDNWYHQVCALTPLDDDMFWPCTFCVAVNTT